LTGWRLDVIGESKFKIMEEEAIAALASIERLDRGTALMLYKQGFRSLDEVAEASEEELGTLEGMGGPANAASLRRRAGEAMERLRLRRIEEAVSGEKVLTDREEMLLLSGVTARVGELLVRSGYRSVNDLKNERDIDRMAIRTGLGSRKAQEIVEGVAAYFERDSERVNQGQNAARERQSMVDSESRGDGEASVGSGAEGR
jgi:N utilization substance protein A